MGDLKHLVLVKFKEGAAVEDIIKGMEKLATGMETVKGFEWGQDSGSEAGLGQGYTHVFILTFKTAEDFAAFLAHPTHLEFAANFAAGIENILVFDFPSVLIKPTTAATAAAAPPPA
ncbi:stress-response A/B barrel domain-containing protein At5g22580-like [Aristolochia californica]|uniref:stress-response A/B barrel domain-containing protein At5g22580-like n=1 Tax=Aristolochia californica TaxID=171875 RepID=UPI0035DE5032